MAAFGRCNQTSKDSLDTGLCCSPAGNGDPGWRTVNTPFLPRNVLLLPTAPFLVVPLLQAAPPTRQPLPEPGDACLPGGTLLPSPAFLGQNKARPSIRSLLAFTYLAVQSTCR